MPNLFIYSLLHSEQILSCALTVYERICGNCGETFYPQFLKIHPREGSLQKQNLIEGNAYKPANLPNISSATSDR